MLKSTRASSRADMGLDADAHQPVRKRTIWLWIITVWIIYIGVTGVVLLAIHLLGIRPMGWYDSPVLGVLHAINVATIVVQCAAGLALFYFRPVAVWLFLSATLLVIGGQLVAFFDPATRDFMARTQGQLGLEPKHLMVVSATFSILLSCLPLIYAIVLRRRNWLR